MNSSNYLQIRICLKKTNPKNIQHVIAPQTNYWKVKNHGLPAWQTLILVATSKLQPKHYKHTIFHLLTDCWLPLQFYRDICSTPSNRLHIESVMTRTRFYTLIFIFTRINTSLNVLNRSRIHTNEYHHKTTSDGEVDDFVDITVHTIYCIMESGPICWCSECSTILVLGRRRRRWLTVSIVQFVFCVVLKPCFDCWSGIHQLSRIKAVFRIKKVVFKAKLLRRRCNAKYLVFDPAGGGDPYFMPTYKR